MPVAKNRIVLMGEAMLELSHPEGQGARLSYGGDVLNTSIYLARLGLRPHFVTALGCDPYSDGMLREWERECVQTGYIPRDPNRLPGLYAIQTDHMGERSFYYWRSESAACNFFNLESCSKSVAFMKSTDWFVISGITLSIFNEGEREQLAAVAKSVKARGGEVIFDPNYRSAGWPDHEAARAALQTFAGHATLILPTLDDENLLYGQMPGEAHAARWHDLGIDTVICKRGPSGAVIYQSGNARVNVAATVCQQPVDTTGAGDSFNAAFIASKWLGHSNEDAAKAGNQLANHVIRYPGAIIPAEGMPDIFPE